MARRNSSSFANRRLRQRQDVVRIYNTEDSSGRVSRGSTYSYVANTSDTGTYEIEICERQSLNCSSASTLPTSSKVSTASVDSGLSKCENYTESRYSMESSKPEQNIHIMNECPLQPENGLVQSCYPCPSLQSKLLKNDQLKPRVELIDKDTNTVFKTVDRGQSCDEYKSDSAKSDLSYMKENDNIFIKSDTESNSSCSTCFSTTSTSDSTKSDNSLDESDSNRKAGTFSSKSSRNCESPRTCDSTEEKNLLKENCNKKLQNDYSDETTSDNCIQKGKTNIVLELIREEVEDEEGKKQSLKTANIFGNSNCFLEIGIKNYEERLKKLENYYLANVTIKNVENKTFEESKTRTSHHVCNCPTAAIGFTEINHRINALEKLYKTSLESEFEKPVYRLNPENSDNTAQTAIELAKIKKRLLHLEEKIMNHKSYCASYVQCIENNSVVNKQSKASADKMKINSVEQCSSLSDREIQVVDFDKEEDQKIHSEEDFTLNDKTTLDAYYFRAKINSCNKTRLKDEAIQTPSKKQLDQYSFETELKLKKRKSRSKKSYGTISLCKCCRYHVSQKSGDVRGTSKEKRRRHDEYFQEKNENHNGKNTSRIKESFATCPINVADKVASKEIRKSHLRESRHFNNNNSKSNNKPKRNRKKFKLCQKDSMMNVKDSFASNASHGEFCPPFTPHERFQKSFNSWNMNSSEMKKSSENFHTPPRSLQVYRTRHMEQSLLLHNPPMDETGKSSAHHPCQVEDSTEILSSSTEILNVYSYSTIEGRKSILHENFSNDFSENSENLRKNELSNSTTQIEQNSSHSSNSNNMKINRCHRGKSNGKTKMAGRCGEVRNTNRIEKRIRDSETCLSAVEDDAQDEQSSFNSWKKLFRKLHLSQSVDKQTHFSLSEYDNSRKAEEDKFKGKSKSFNLSSIFKRTWI